MTQEITIPAPSAVVDQPTGSNTRQRSKKKPTRDELQALWDKEQIRKAKHSEMQAKYYKKKKEAGKKYVTVLVNTAYDKDITDAGYKRIGIVYSRGPLPFEGFSSFRTELDGSVYIEYFRNNKLLEVQTYIDGQVKAKEVSRNHQ